MLKAQPHKITSMETVNKWWESAITFYQETILSGPLTQLISCYFHLLVSISFGRVTCKRNCRLSDTSHLSRSTIHATNNWLGSRLFSIWWKNIIILFAVFLLKCTCLCASKIHHIFRAECKFFSWFPLTGIGSMGFY